MRRRRKLPGALWILGGTSVALACSLTVPSEEELFSLERASGGNGGAGGGSSGGSGAGTAGKAAAAGQGGDAGGAGGAAGAGGETSDAGQGGQPSAGAGGSDEGPLGGTSSGGAGEGGSGGEIVHPFDPALGLVAHYRFDETSGTVAVEEIDSAHDATILGTTTWVAEGKIGGALRLSGSSDSYVEFPPTTFSELDEVSFAIWFKLDSLTIWSRVLDLGSSTTHWMYYAPAAVQANRQGSHAALDVANFITAELHFPETQPAPAQWNHIVITWKRERFALYTNGALLGDDTDAVYSPQEFAAQTPGGETLRAWLGRSTFPDPFLAATIDDFRIYDRSLSDSDVAALYELEE